jgi:hypothetical protein
MKTVLTLALVLLAAGPGRAQIFRPPLPGAHGPRPHHSSTSVSVGFSSGPWRAYPGYGDRFGYGYGYPRGYRAVSAYYPGYDCGYYPYSGYSGTSSAAANGLWLGALAGGIIGNNTGAFGHSGWRGAAWGAGLGWFIGSVADATRRVNSVPSAPAYPAATGPAAPAAAPTTVINNYYNAPATPMSGANSLFGRN